VLDATEAARPDISNHEISKMELEFLPVSGENTHIVTDFCGVCNCGCKCCKQR